MDNHHLRSILLNLQYRLSDDDRERLHFYLKNDVPRPLGDDSTLSGTLRLMQSLFDQDKISERDFTLLIDAFKQIQCFDAVNLLKEHQRRMRLSGLNQSTQSLASMMPSLIEEFMNDYEDDKVCTDNFLLNRMNYSNNNNNIIDSTNITINDGTQKGLSSRKQWLCMSSLTILPLILFILTLGILIVVLIEGNNRINNLENNLRIKESFIAQAQNENNQTAKQSNKFLLEEHERIEQFNKTITELKNQNNQTVRQWNDQLLEKNETIEHLNKTLVECKKERKTLLIKAGRIFGGDGGGDFDDSSLRMFTPSYYLSGFIFFDIENFDSCQFIYTSSHDNQSRIESNIYGLYLDRSINSTYEYHLDDDERVDQVRVKSYYVRFNNSEKIAYLIRGLQFVTTKGRRFPPGTPLSGYDVQLESIPGYTVGYVTGKTGQKIDQLQFFWYQTKQ